MRIAVGLCLLLAVGTTKAEAQLGGVPLVDSVPSITVDGVAKREVRPDVAVVTLGVTTDLPTAADAAGDNGRASSAVVTAARHAGLADADIHTSQFRLFALHDQHDQGKTTGFRASNEVDLRIHDLDKVGAIVGQLVAQGVNSIEGVDFQVADPEPVLDDLRTKATQQAQAAALSYAHAAGLTLGRVLRIAPSGGMPMPLVRGFRVQSGAAASPPVEAGSETLEAHVQITWELLQASAPKP